MKFDDPAKRQGRQTKDQTKLLRSLDLPTDFSHIPEEQWDAVEEVISHEMLTKGIENDELNEYGILCESVIDALPEEATA